MRNAFAVAATLTLLLSGSVLAQDETPSVNLVPNDDFCNLVADDPEACGRALTTLASAGMLPEAFAGLMAVPTDTPATSAGLGETQVRDDVAITLEDVAWGAESLIEPEDGMENVSLLVSYEALADVASSSPLYWGVADREGIGYRYSAFGKDPSLVGGAVREDRGIIEGWVTFQVPEGTSWIEVSETRTFDEPLSWVIER